MRTFEQSGPRIIDDLRKANVAFWDEQAATFKATMAGSHVKAPRCHYPREACTCQPSRTP